MSTGEHGKHGHSVKVNVSKILILGPRKEAPKAMSILASSKIFHPENTTALETELELTHVEDLADRIVKYLAETKS